MLDKKNALLKTIQDDIESVISAKTKGSNSPISNESRHSILDLLVNYSSDIPHPASGMDSEDESRSSTLIRWQILAYVSSIDLTIAKWFESHLDALSILTEVGYDQPIEGLCAVWASEGHPDPIRYNKGSISGTKAWCSGANFVKHGLLTYRDSENRSQLVIVDMQQAGISVDNSEWQAVGMQNTDTATIHFDKVAADNVGAANAYLKRVGFWHGAAGVAACWYGATVSLAHYLIAAQQNKPSDFRAMYLGQISTSLTFTRQYFDHVANLLDTQPHHSHELAVRHLRVNAEQTARQVIETVGQALGAAPLCRNAHFARLSADLAVFIRQSHGAHDLQKIGELTSALDSSLTISANNRQSTIWQL